MKQQSLVLWKAGYANFFSSDLHFSHTILSDILFLFLFESLDLSFALFLNLLPFYAIDMVSYTFLTSPSCAFTTIPCSVHANYCFCSFRYSHLHRACSLSMSVGVVCKEADKDEIHLHIHACFSCTLCCTPNSVTRT
jgi:hypothetical protein